MANTKLPKDVGGVEIPQELRKLGNKLVRRIKSPVGKDAALAAMTLAAAAVIAIRDEARCAPTDDDDDASERASPPAPPIPPVPPVPPMPPVAPEPPEPPVRPRPHTAASAPSSPAQAQAMADALGNVAQAALTRFMGGRRPF